MATWLRIARTLHTDNGEGEGERSELQEDELYDWKLALTEAVDCWMDVFQTSRDTVQFSKFHSSKVVTGVGLGDSGEKVEKVETGKSKGDTDCRKSQLVEGKGGDVAKEKKTN